MIAIIGILVALLLPAVQAAREAARRMHCTDQLKQLGLGMHSYHAAHNSFPPGSLANDPDNRSALNHKAVHAWTVFIMPFIEMTAMADAYDWNAGFRGPNYGALNGPLFKTRIKLFECPSDVAGVFGVEPCCPATEGVTRSNYVVCLSPDGSYMEKGVTKFDKACNDVHNPATKRALFNWNLVRGIRDIRDGTSNTVILSEVIAGPSGTLDLRGGWGGDLGSGYSHLRTPNSSIPDQLLGGAYCNPAKAPCTGTSPCWSTEIVAARSNHPGGVVAVRADGSVRFFSDSIAAQLWIDLASIDGREVVSLD